MNPNAYASSALLLCLWFCVTLSSCQLDCMFYTKTCPNLEKIVRNGVASAIASDSRIAASLLRLHFHDCFVNGCDGSVLLDDTGSFVGEKNAFPNRNSARGFETIDAIKTSVEKACPSTVSCADILTLASREAVFLSGGPFLSVPLGRQDGRTASQAAANTDLPGPTESLASITAKFAAKGLDEKDVVALSGAHTLGFAQCFTFKQRLFDFDGAGNPDPALSASTLASLRSACPNVDSSNSNLVPLDAASSTKFDNSYFKNIVNGAAVLQSDQVLMNSSRASGLVINYSQYPFLFSRDFAASMIKMGNIGVLVGQNGEIRKNCRFVN